MNHSGDRARVKRGEKLANNESATFVNDARSSLVAANKTFSFPLDGELLREKANVRSRGRKTLGRLFSVTHARSSVNNLINQRE